MPIQELNPEYTFENFVVGQSNRLAHAGAVSVAYHPGRSYNPLYIYGDEGLGKTHLLHAIGQHARSEGRLVICLTALEYENNVLQAIKNGERDNFQNRYSSLNFLLVDDIDYLGQTEEAQEWFFHWFNTLYSDSCQIVIASSRHPRSLQLLDERLVSRFEQGLVTNIAPPNLETRVAILRSRASAQNVEFNPEVLDLIASRKPDSIRRLVGALNGVIHFQQTNNIGQITFEETVEALETIDNKKNRPVVKPETIIQIVSEKFGIEVDAIKGPKRGRDMVIPRHVSMYLIQMETSISLADIGRELGGKDHSTVAHACNKIRDELQYNLRLRHQVEEIRETLYRQYS